MSGFWKVCSFLCTQYLVGPPFAWITASMRRGMKTISNFWYLWQCGQVSSPAGKWNQHLHKACQQKEAWSALKCPGRWLRWLWTSENTRPTPADDMAAQIITDCGNFTLDFKQHGFCVSPLFLQTLGPWFPNEMQNLLSSEKRTLDHWATVQFLFSLAQVRCFWWCFQLQFTLCEALPSVWISFAWQYSQACGHPCCFSTFSFPISSFQSTLHVICFDTALLEQPPLSVMILCDLPSLWRVSMIVFWTIAKSAVFPIIVV